MTICPHCHRQIPCDNLLPTTAGNKLTCGYCAHRWVARGGRPLYGNVTGSAVVGTRAGKITGGTPGSGVQSSRRWKRIGRSTRVGGGVG